MRTLLLATTAALMIPAQALMSPAMAADSAQAAQDAPPPLPRGRLGDAVVPTAYRLDLTVDPAQPRFSGRVEIDTTIKTVSRHVYLHGRNLTMRRAPQVTVGGRTLTAKWQEVGDTGILLLTFAEPLPVGAATFAFDYDAAFNDGPAGMFRVKVGDAWYSWTQFESVDARAAFPGFDQPGYKQPFTVTLRTPAGLKAVSNAPEASVTQEGGLDVHRFAATAPLPTYLVAMMVGPFASVAGTVAPTPERAAPLPLRILSPQPNGDKLDFALQNSQPIVALLERYFGRAFPYPKLDQITAPIMPGAMENAGADLYQDALIVMDENASTRRKRSFGMVVAHELAHQWFGDLVTPAWWDDIWLNESFANWMGFRIGHEWRPDLNVAGGALDEGFDAMTIDSLIAGRPIRQPITDSAQIDAAFDRITYGKGGHVVAMIAAYMGDAKFQAGVRRYMAAHAYGNATSTDFFRAMAEVAGDPRILPAMQGFVDQQGVPLLTFAGADGRFAVTQSRYAPFGVTAPQTRWGVPMCVAAGDTRQCQLVEAAGTAVSLPAGVPVVPNAGGTGYYRFELPGAEWDRLIAASDRLPGGEGLALADSLSASFLAGRNDVARLVALARTMSRNPDSYAADAALAAVTLLDRSHLVEPRAREAYRALVRGIVAPRLEAMGFDPRAGAYAAQAPEASERRIQLVTRMAGAARDAQIRATLADAAQAWLKGDVQALDPAWFGLAFGAYLRRAMPGKDGMTAARALLDRALASQDPVFRPSALGALATTGDAGLAKWLLNDLKDQRLRTSERLQMMTAIIGTEETRELGYDWMRGHLRQLRSDAGGIFFASRLPQVFLNWCAVDKADSFARRFRPLMRDTSGALDLERAIERVRNCGVLRQARAKSVSDALIGMK
ncbi:M1 family peptidase [Novosphingobium sp. FSY-8]|uniref:Aminopeptidase n=1 Tax=Novosphingobium ovatum TaxID=1908523 RepID=A0ABW9XGC7_9SPHN|nr:M1 family metallopeptidase [Novosphingobium ovatum]NBC37604.1 M1 family peptidase [Novosphingobium ovatum]